MTGIETYRETHIQEYHSTYVKETEQFFEENMGKNDVVVYNWEAYRIVYTYYFDEDKLFFQDSMDFSADYENIWYLDTFNNEDISQEVLDAHGLHKEYVGHMGIEQNEFDLYRISHGGAQ